MILPEEYIVQKFYSYNGGVKYLKHQHVYQGSCFICKEGSSWLKKKRCYYIVKEDVICCHNCGWYSKPLKWIQEVTGNSFAEIFNEARTYEFIPKEAKKEISGQIAKTTKSELIGLIGNIAIFYRQQHNPEKRKIKLP